MDNFGYILIKIVVSAFPAWLELENRLLARFDAASQRRELSTMAECAKILSQVSYLNFVFIINTKVKDILDAFLPP